MRLLIGIFLAALVTVAQTATGTATYTAPSVSPGSIAVSAGICTSGSASSTGVCCTATAANNAVPATQVNLTCQIGAIPATYQIPAAALAQPYSFKQTFGTNEVDMSFTIANGVITGTGTAIVNGTAGKPATGPF